MKNILVLVASTHKNGNTDQLADAFIRGAEEAGQHVEKIFLGTTVINGCLGCNACKWGKPCVQRDDFAEILPKIQKADALVFASPLYYWTISARMKAVIERLYCLSEPDPHPPLGRYEKYPEKDCALLMTSADNYFWTFEQAESYYKFALIHYLGFHDKGTILAGGCGGSHTERKIAQTPHLQQAYEFGKTFYR